MRRAISHSLTGTPSDATAVKKLSGVFLVCERQMTLINDQGMMVCKPQKGLKALSASAGQVLFSRN